MYINHYIRYLGIGTALFLYYALEAYSQPHGNPTLEKELDAIDSRAVIMEGEAPVVQRLLAEANELLAKDDSNSDDAYWLAAEKFCQASRYGSSEGMYRLGLFYMLGIGVPENTTYASALYSLAARNGHFGSQKMLEIFPAHSISMPSCVTSATPPERYIGLRPTIDEHVAKLPKNKRWIVNLVKQIATVYQVDYRLVLSVISVESEFKTTAKSTKNARGLMQLIPETAERFNVKNVHNASQNIKGGVKYLSWLLSYFRGNVILAVAAYNSGEGNVDRYKGVPPFKETKRYVKKVMALYARKNHSYDADLTEASPIVPLSR